MPVFTLIYSGSYFKNEVKKIKIHANKGNLDTRNIYFYTYFHISFFIFHIYFLNPFFKQF